MLSILLDTHILMWWRSDPQRLTKPQVAALAALESRAAPAGISAITLWEMAKMIERGRAEITAPLDDWLAEIESHPLLTVLPLTGRIVAESVRLGNDFHRDPADQMIVATARCHGLKLVTSDERIRRWAKVPLI